MNRWKTRKAKRLTTINRMNAGRARKHAQDHKNDAIRESRTVEITIRDSHRPMQIVKMRQDERGEGRWSRWTVEGLTCRPLGNTGIGKLIATYAEIIWCLSRVADYNLITHIH